MPAKHANRLNNKHGLVAACTAILLASLLCPTLALAKDVFLGAFMDRSAGGTSDYLYVSLDGKTFERVGVPYTPLPNMPAGDEDVFANVNGAKQKTLHDPGIGYKDGVFWMMSGFTIDWNGGWKFIPMFGSSRDLVTWTYPQRPSGCPGTVTPAPDTKGKLGGGAFDCAGGDFMFDDNGDCWVVVSLGYYGEFHGEPHKDYMQPYICKITDLERNPWNEYVQWLDGPDLGASPLGNSGSFTRINLPVSSENWIDPSIYKENGTYYLSIKRDGITNHIFAIGDLNNAGDSRAWANVNNNVVTGYEGPCLTKSGSGTYFFYTDKLNDFSDGNGSGFNGIFYQTSNSLSEGWSWPLRIITVDEYGNSLPNRHGSVVRIDDPNAQQLIMSLRNAKGYKWTRLFGGGRYETMAAIVQECFADDSSTWAIIACGDNYPDALVASSLAGLKDCPIILTAKDRLSNEAKAELERLGVTNAFIMGGTAAVSADAQAEIEALGIACERIAGNDRQETSMIALQKIVETVSAGQSANPNDPNAATMADDNDPDPEPEPEPEPEVTGPDTIVIATGKGYADTLSIGPWCYATHTPMLLTGKSDETLTDAEYELLANTPSIKNVVIVGGTGVVDEAVEAKLVELGYSVERIAGNNRYETSQRIAEWELERGIGVSNATVACGQNFPDALAGSALCGRNNSVMLLAHPQDFNANALGLLDSDLGGGVQNGYILGGTSAVPAEVYKKCTELTR